MEECAVGVFEKCAQSHAVFLGLEDGAEGVDIGDAVGYGNGVVKDDMCPYVVLGLV